MPHLSSQHYHKIHQWLAELWTKYQATFGLVSPQEQWYLHDYFVLDRALSEAELLAYRKQVRSDRPSLPQCAGRAVRKLHAKIKAAQAQPVTAGSEQSAGRERRVVVGAVVNPQVDVDRLVRGLLRAADDLGQAAEQDEPHDSLAA